MEKGKTSGKRVDTYRTVEIAVLILLGAMLNLSVFFAFVYIVDSRNKTKERQSEHACAETEWIDGLSVCFTGFDYEEIETIRLKRMREGHAIDSLTFRPERERDRYHESRSLYWATAHSPIHLRDEYHIVLPSGRTYVLSEMKTASLPRHTKFSVFYQCQLNEYTLDGIKYDGSSTVLLVKEGYLYPWEQDSEPTIEQVPPHPVRRTDR